VQLRHSRRHYSGQYVAVLHCIGPQPAPERGYECAQKAHPSQRKNVNAPQHKYMRFSAQINIASVGSWHYNQC
jgi:hypothetical protein